MASAAFLSCQKPSRPLMSSMKRMIVAPVTSWRKKESTEANISNRIIGLLY